MFGLTSYGFGLGKIGEKKLTKQSMLHLLSFYVYLFHHYLQSMLIMSGHTLIELKKK